MVVGVPLVVSGVLEVLAALIELKTWCMCFTLLLLKVFDIKLNKCGQTEWLCYGNPFSL